MSSKLDLIKKSIDIQFIYNIINILIAWICVSDDVT